MAFRILVRGGGDLASGVVLRLHRAGWQVLVAELAQPLAVRRMVSFAEAVYQESVVVEDVVAHKAESLDDAQKILETGAIPVLPDEHLAALPLYKPHVLVDARMRKSAPEIGRDAAPLAIGLGPGFTAGVDCHAVIETNRGPYLGRVYWSGQAQPDTGVPEHRGGYRTERVLRAPANGALEPLIEIGSWVAQGALIARVDGRPITAPFDGMLRGLIHGGVRVSTGDKIGDLDPRENPQLSQLVSDKALSIAGGVLEAILSWELFRPFWREW